MSILDMGVLILSWIALLSTIGGGMCVVDALTTHRPVSRPVLVSLIGGIVLLAIFMTTKIDVTAPMVLLQNGGG
jgi:nicotinamide riboside transporter PnuC